jgi:hypothetical protein
MPIYRLTRTDRSRRAWQRPLTARRGATQRRGGCEFRFFKNWKLVAGFALSSLCWRRASALHCPEIEVEQGFLFVALVFVLLA